MCSSDHHAGDIIVLETDIEATFHRGNQTPQSATSFKDTAEVKSSHTFAFSYLSPIKIKYLFQAMKSC